MTKKLLISLLEEKKYKEILAELDAYNPVDLAELLFELDERELAIVFRLIEKAKAAETFSYMDNDQRQALLSTFSSQEIKYILDSMYADDAVDFLEDMPSNVVTHLLENVDFATRADINRLLKYSEDSVGSIMTTEFIEFAPTMTVEQALAKIRTVGIDSETIYTCYVVEKRKLIGIVTAKDLMTSKSDVLISDLMTDNFIFAATSDDREEAANIFRKYKLIALPVVDTEGCIVGIVTFDDAIDVLTEETTEDMRKMAAITTTEGSYLKTSVFQHAKSRIGWLLILMISASITGSVIAKYENAFTAIPLLVAFIPMLMDTGGNCGSQSSTLIIRGLAVGELHFADFFRIIWKEFRVSLIVSLALAFANGLQIYLRYGNFSMSLVVSLTLVATVVISKLVGCILPVLATKVHLDPAIMAAPLITTIVDMVSIIVYFRIATLVFAL